MSRALKGEFSDTLISGKWMGEMLLSFPQRPPSLPRDTRTSPRTVDTLRGMSDWWPLFLGLPRVGDRAFTSSLSLPEDKADPGHSEISATRCPKVPGRVLVHTSVSPSPDNLRRFALEREASEQVDIYLWKLVEGEHWPIPAGRTSACPLPVLWAPRGLRGIWLIKGLWLPF